MVELSSRRNFKENFETFIEHILRQRSFNAVLLRRVLQRYSPERHSSLVTRQGPETDAVRRARNFGNSHLEATRTKFDVCE